MPAFPATLAVIVENTCAASKTEIIKIRVVEAAFTGRFAAGFVDGPRFAFDETIAQGMSGGPVLSETGSSAGSTPLGRLASSVDSPMLHREDAERR